MPLLLPRLDAAAPTGTQELGPDAEAPPSCVSEGAKYIVPGTLLAMTEEQAICLVPVEAIKSNIQLLRGRHVMLDEDLAKLYGVETRRLVEQVKRNSERFPEDFMFQMSKEEAVVLRSQSATSKPGRGGRRYAPYAFTELGVAMLSSVLRSERAVAVNIEIMRAFVEARRMAASHDRLARRLDDLERETSSKLGKHEKYFSAIFESLRQLTAPPPKAKRRVGFAPGEEEPVE